MTYNEIKTKFLIEYDKANVTSSYPSLTDYEIATILDKAYLALIAQKVTGNNLRRSYLESDIKSVSDIQGLIISVKKNRAFVDGLITNLSVSELPGDFLYFVQGVICRHFTKTDRGRIRKYQRATPIKLVSHETAQKFFVTDYNKPWIKIPVAYIEDGNLYIVDDPKYNDALDLEEGTNITYVRLPYRFTNDDSDEYEFECTDSMAEELISLAITFALENVESPRLNTKLNTRGLEA